jgi:hypothetical protein
MTKRFATCLAAVTCLAAAPITSRAQTVLIEGFGGYQGLQPTFASISNATSGSEGTGIVGGDILAQFGGLGVGALVDKTVSGNFGQPWTGSLLGGFIVPVTIVRLEILGEIGRRAANSFGDIFGSNAQTIIGVRPGVRFRFAPTPLNIGLGGILRWPTSGGDFGSPDYGIVGRVGFEFP